MNVIDPGRTYELNTGIVLHFLHNDGARKTCDGTTNEEVLEALIHRVTDAYQQVPCEETVHALYLLQAALRAFRMRTSRRVSANVEGTNQRHDSKAACEPGVPLKRVIPRDSRNSRAPLVAESRCHA